MKIRAAWTLAILLAAAGCHEQAGNEARNAPVAGASANPNAAIIAAAEPFEALTEQAQSADWPKIDRLIADARAQLDTSRAKLPQASAARIDQQVAAIGTERRTQNRLGVALASVEGYRTIVEAQDAATAQPPVPVSLLDYAGFRFDALARSPTVDWRRMAESSAFAHQQWAALKPSVKSIALAGVVDSSLAAMDEAVKRKDVTLAQSAAATELALVDLLEEQVAPR